MAGDLFFSSPRNAGSFQNRNMKTEEPPRLVRRNTIDGCNDGASIDAAVKDQKQADVGPLKEDLAQWLRTILGSDITAENFMDVLSDGLIVNCLVQHITDKKTGAVPQRKPVLQRRTSRSKFEARDNVERFLQKCKELGVRQVCLFESNDLVEQKNPRQVVICLLELARVGVRYGIEPPSLIKLEKEIENDEKLEAEHGHFNYDEDDEGKLFSFQSDTDSDISMPTDTDRSLLNDSERSEFSDNNISRSGSGSLETVMEHSESTRTSQGNSYAGNRHNCDTSDIGGLSIDETNNVEEDETATVQAPLTPRKLSANLDVEIKRLIRHMDRCMCEEQYQIMKLSVSPPRYKLGGKKVHIKILNEKHLMVRIGGGWDTLLNYLERHDPCRVKDCQKKLRKHSLQAATVFNS